MTIESSPTSALPPATREPVRADRIVPPPVESIHGWSAERVQALQQQTAEALGRPVGFRGDRESGGRRGVMVVIPAGRFLMGSPPDEPEREDDERQHEVEVVSFALGKYAVTFEEYDRFTVAGTGLKPL